MEYKVFLFIVLSVLISCYGYIGFRIIIPLKIRIIWKSALWTLLILLIPLAPIYLILRKQGIDAAWYDALHWVAYLSLGFFSLVFTLLFLRDMAALLMYIFNLASRALMPVTDTVAPKYPARRNFLIHSTNLGILGVSGILSGCGVYNTRCDPGIKSVAVPIDNLPKDLEGFRIVQISDIHVGPTLKQDYIKNVVNIVNNLSPHVIALTGDLADGPVSRFRNEVAPLMDLSAPYGSYFVTGNHEYYAGVEAWLEKIDRLGFVVLLNSHRIIQHGAGSILLGGVTDFSAGRFFETHISDPYAALCGAQDTSMKILLAHQPRTIFASSKVGYDLQLSGHTHGGQFYPWQFLVYLQQPYLAGLHKFNATWIYVSRGTGYWGPPIRLGAPPEITEITMVKALTGDD